MVIIYPTRFIQGIGLGIQPRFYCYQHGIITKSSFLLFKKKIKSKPKKEGKENEEDSEEDKEEYEEIIEEKKEDKKNKKKKK